MWQYFPISPVLDFLYTSEPTSVSLSTGVPRHFLSQTRQQYHPHAHPLPMAPLSLHSSIATSVYVSRPSWQQYMRQQNLT